MIFREIIDPDCPDCHGNGNVIVCDDRDGKTWCSSIQCPCVQYYHDDEMKAFLKRALSTPPQDSKP